MLCQEDLTQRAQLGILSYPAGEQIPAAVTRGVATFLRAYAVC